MGHQQADQHTHGHGQSHGQGIGKRLDSMGTAWVNPLNTKTVLLATMGCVGVVQYTVGTELVDAWVHSRWDGYSRRALNSSTRRTGSFTTEEKVHEYNVFLWNWWIDEWMGDSGDKKEIKISYTNYPPCVDRQCIVLDNHTGRQYVWWNITVRWGMCNWWYL